jgi:tRNA-specific 2-thiouridylase
MTPDQPSRPPIRAIGLISGGLDSLLAAHVVRDQGVEVLGLSFESPFFGSARAKVAAQAAGIPLRIVNFTSDILGLVEHPKHGFGQGLNPCIDCHARMLRRANEIRIAEGYDFLFTGEVLNQRPMSQTSRTLRIVAREAGVEDVLVRPLSARTLPESEVEKRGWLDRSRLLAIQGRSRRGHREVAARFGLTDLPKVSAGCCLAEPNFSRRLRELRKSGGIQDLDAVNLLFHGRHFRLNEDVKLIVGRNEEDNNDLEKLQPRGYLFLHATVENGPVCLLSATANEKETALAAAICARYVKAAAHGPVRFTLRMPDGSRHEELVASPVAQSEFEARRIL